MAEPLLLLHSLTFYADLIGRLAALPPLPDIVEIGSESGAMSEELAETASGRNGRLFVVEPFPSERLRSLAQRRPAVRVIHGRSPEALNDLPAAGLYVIDGDHNYAVVRAELETILGNDEAHDTIIVMHDVGWPCARRDMYYDPTALPAQDVRDHSFTRGALRGPALAPPGLGYRSNGHFAFALDEGGPRNGVLTAVEDVLTDHPDVAMMSTPLVFGLAVLANRTAAHFDAVESLMAPYTQNPTLAAMEQNRIDLFLKFLELQDSHWRARAGRLRSRVLRTGASRRP